jgi:DNA helicase II / ATP-dependent DNA helicase PcrA
MDLNEEQLSAATHPQGAASLLLAGAGSGKTTVLTARISWLIEQGVPPRKILAITFTNKAANEIRERVLKHTGLPEDQAPRLSTIHSLALSLIRKNPLGFGLGSRISPLDDYDQNQLLKRIVEREKLDINPYQLRDQIAYHRARGVGFRVDYTDDVHQKALREHSGYHALTKHDLEVWELFEIEKTANSSIDFDDMLHLVNRRAIRDPEWLVKLQAVFAHILMDECQDTSVTSWIFINNLVGPENRNLYCVGDCSQSIYSFNGSSPDLIMKFAEHWRGSAPALYRIARNHRSVPQIVDLANSIQKTMTGTLPLQMESFRGLSGESGAWKVLHGETPSELARSLANQISGSRRSYKEYAILVRSGTQIRDIEGELVRARIPYVVRGGSSLLQTEEVRDVLSYVRFATNTNDFSALSRATSAPKCGIGDVALEGIRRIANESFHGDLLLAMASNGTKFAGFADTVRNIQKHTDNPVAALNAAIGLTGYVSHLKRKYAKDAEKVTSKTENLARLRLMIEGLTADAAISTADVVFQLTLDRTEKETERGAVTVSTIHSAKGLEWPVVAVTNFVESSIPHWRSSNNPDELEEERRLAYVAVTRARDILYICIPEKVQRGQYLSYVDPSRFLQELGIR